MKKTVLLLSFMTIPLLTGCSNLFWNKEEVVPPQVEIVTREVPVDIFQPPSPAPLQLEDIRWHVITEENLEEKLSEIKGILGNDFVVFAMIPQSYENMAFNIQELKRYIKEQQQIIIYYRKATTSHLDLNKDGKVDANDWLEIQATDNE